MPTNSFYKGVHLRVSSNHLLFTWHQLQGLWAPPGPQAIAAPEVQNTVCTARSLGRRPVLRWQVLVVGLGRRLRADEAKPQRMRTSANGVTTDQEDGPRARLGAGAVEAGLQRSQHSSAVLL